MPPNPCRPTSTRARDLLAGFDRLVTHGAGATVVLGRKTLVITAHSKTSLPVGAPWEGIRLGSVASSRRGLHRGRAREHGFKFCIAHQKDAGQSVRHSPCQPGARSNGTRDDRHASIRERTQDMLNSIIEVWPVPDGHRSDITVVADRPKRTVDLADLIAAGILQEGMTLYARPAKHHGVTATLLPDGGIDVDGTRFRTPSGAGKAVAKRSTNGWAFRGIDPESKTSLRRLWREYVEQRNVEADDTEVAGDDDEDDS